MGILFAILTSFLLALGNIFLKKSYKEFSQSVAFFIFSIFSLILWGGLGFILGVNFDNPFLGIFVGFTSAILGQATYIYTLSKGELSITATILSSFSIYTIIFSILFNHEKPSFTVLLFIVLAILGTIIVSFPEKGQFNKKDLHQIKLIGLAVLTAIGIGAADTLTKFYITRTSVGTFLFWVAIAQFIVSFAYLRLQKESLSQFDKILSKLKEYKFSLLGSLAIATSTMFLFLGFSFALASIVSPISATYPIVTVILALIFLKERLRFKNSLGIILLLISVVGVGFYSL